MFLPCTESEPLVYCECIHRGISLGISYDPTVTSYIQSLISLVTDTHASNCVCVCLYTYMLTLCIATQSSNNLWHFLLWSILQGRAVVNTAGSSCGQYCRVELLSIQHGRVVVNTAGPSCGQYCRVEKWKKFLVKYSGWLFLDMRNYYLCRVFFF